MSGRLIGLIAPFSIAVVATSLSYLHPSFEALAISIILGMLFANLLEERAELNEGVTLTIRIFLPLGIALYGLQLHIGRPDISIIIPVLATYTMIFGSIYLLTQFFNLDKKTSILLATGMSTCGASAIAIVSPLIKARSEDTSTSLLTVMIYGMLAMILYPALSDLVGLNTMEYAFLSGTTLPMLGQVKVAAGSCGAECANMAVKYKLIRISLLAVVTTVAIILSREGKRGFYIPWFVMVFLILAICVNIFNMGKIPLYSAPFSRFFLSTALAAIGMQVDFNSISETGLKPVLITFLSMILTIIALYMTYYIITI